MHFQALPSEMTACVQILIYTHMVWNTSSAVFESYFERKTFNCTVGVIISSFFLFFFTSYISIFSLWWRKIPFPWRVLNFYHEKEMNKKVTTEKSRLLTLYNITWAALRHDALQWKVEQKQAIQWCLPSWIRSYKSLLENLRGVVVSMSLAYAKTYCTPPHCEPTSEWLAQENVRLKKTCTVLLFQYITWVYLILYICHSFLQAL